METPKKSQRERFNCRLPGSLKTWAEKYARKKNKTVTQLIVDQLQSLKEKEEARGVR